MVTANNYVTETYKTPLIQILTWFFLASAIISVLCRAYTKWAIVRFATLDDYLVPISLLFLTGQSVAVTLQTTNGYGKPMKELTDAQISAVLKAEYAATLLYIPSLLFSKLPTLVLVKKIVPTPRFRRVLYGIGALTTVWAVTSEIVSIFQCRPTKTWDYLQGQCINRKAFFTYFEAMNAFTDLLIILIPFHIVRHIRRSTSLHRRFSVAIVFTARVLPFAVMIVKIVLQIPTYSSSDMLFDTWPVTIATQLIQFLSLTCACILYIRPFLEALTSGFLNGDDLRRRGETTPFVLASNGIDAHVISSKLDRSEKSNNGMMLSSSEGTDVEDILLPHDDRVSSGNDSETQVNSSSIGIGVSDSSLATSVQHPEPVQQTRQPRPQPQQDPERDVVESDQRRESWGLPRVSRVYSSLISSETWESYLGLGGRGRGGQPV